MARSRSPTIPIHSAEAYLYPEVRTIVRSGGCSKSDTEQFGVDPGYAAARNTEQFIARPVRKPDTTEPRGSTPDHAPLVKSLLFGFHASLLYHYWFFMGISGYFHAFLGYLLEFLKFCQYFLPCQAISPLM
jgi:hypothetical protein